METPDVINTIYYAFSTIAQTLAGIVGILTALAIMRLSALSGRLERELPAFAVNCQYPDVFYACLAEGDFEGAIKEVCEDEAINDPMGVGLMLGICARTERQRKQLVTSLRRSLLFTSLVIAFSVGNLLFAQQLASNLTLTWVMFILGFIGLVSCLVFVGALAAQLGHIKLQHKKTKRTGRASG